MTMTSPAQQVPRPLPPPKRMSLRRWLLVLAAVAAAGLVGLAVWWFGVREPPPGPLGADIGEWVGVGRPAGAEWGYGFAVVYNQGDQPAVLERISLVDATPGLEVVGTGIAGSDRKILSMATWMEQPADLGRVVPVKGFRVAPVSEPAGERGAELVFRIRTPRPGDYTSSAVAVEYTVDGKQYRSEIGYRLGVCVQPPAQFEKPRCKAPDSGPQT
jgi:hypothetical protein